MLENPEMKCSVTTFLHRVERVERIRLSDGTNEEAIFIFGDHGSTDSTSPRVIIKSGEGDFDGENGGVDSKDLLGFEISQG